MQENNVKFTATLNELNRVVDHLRSTLPDHAIIFLHGDLAAGKTTLMKAIARSRGVAGEVTSPTFSLQHQYADDLFHYDLYRIDFEELVGLGLLEAFEAPGWHVVEWGSEALADILLQAGFPLCTVSITPEGEGREYSMVRKLEIRN